MADEKFSEFGKGRRSLFGNIICEDKDNIVFSSDPSKFWKDAENSDIINVEEDGTLKFSANGKMYVKWFDVKPNTSYFLSFFGRTDFPNWTDLYFGILGEDGFPFKNYHTKKEYGFFVSREAYDQVLTIKGQDGEWYRRTYMFTVFNTTKIGFFACGNVGTAFLNRIYLCEANNVRNSAGRKESTVFNYCEDINSCALENNYIKDFSCFIKGENYGKFVEITGEKLRYKYNRKGCYYLAWLPLDDDRIYTFVYSDEVKKVGDCLYGFIAENPDGKRKWLSNKSAKKTHGKETNADAIAVVKDDKIAFAVYDGGGEVEFSDFRIFLLGNGVEH